jgi:hypothetical protein
MLFFASLLLSMGCNMPSDGYITLTAPRAAYQNGESVTLELRNDSARSIFLTPSTCKGLDFDGNVEQKTADRFEAIVTQSNQAACALLPDVEVKPGARKTVTWNGIAYQGPFSTFGAQTRLALSGTFRITVEYRDGKNGPKTIAESNEFEIR